MTKFKQKKIPNPQLLRWAEWFSKYSFETKHIPGKKNVLADFLSRPKAPAEINMYIKRPAFHMLNHGVKYKIEKIKDLPSQKYPQEIIQQIQNDSLTENMENLMWQSHTDLFRFNGGSILYPFGLNSNYPFIHPLIWKEDDFPNQLKTLLWYLTNKYLIAIEIPIPKILKVAPHLH